MTTSYVPRPGSVGARALELLIARGEKMLGQDICDEIDVDNPGSFMSLIGIALREGVIAVEKVDGRNWYSVGNGEPSALPAAEDPPPAPPPRKARRAAKPATKRKPKATPPLKAKRAKPRKPMLNRATAGRRAGTAVAIAAPPAPHSGLECALFNTGALHIEIGDGQALRLTRDQARDLVSYLNRIAQSHAGALA